MQGHNPNHQTHIYSSQPSETFFTPRFIVSSDILYWAAAAAAAASPSKMATQMSKKRKVFNLFFQLHVSIVSLFLIWRVLGFGFWCKIILQFVADGVFFAELNELLTRELAEDGYSGVEVRVTPMRTEIIIRATRTQNVLGV